MAQLLGQVNPGTIVKLNENGSPVDFYVAAQDYESGLNGQGRVLLVRKDAYNKQRWNNTNVNAWETSSILTWLNGTYKNLLDSGIQPLLGTTQYYYTPGNGNYTVATRSDAVFLLSFTELGQSDSYANIEGSRLPIYGTLKIAFFNGASVIQWTRSPLTGGSDSDIWTLNHFGENVFWVCSDSGISVRPAFTLPSTMLVESDGTLSPSPNLNIYIPTQAMQNQPIPVQWSPVTNAEEYQLQRNTGSTWETIYTGTDTSFTDTAGDWTTVQYQVAVKLLGIYGAYTQSQAITVVPASTLAISGQDGDLGTITTDIDYTVTSDTGNPIDLVRTVNGVQYGARTVESGFAYSIPVMELPTGFGTIVITATVQATRGPVTVTRTWTYNKTSINFPNSASVAGLSIAGENIMPTTLAEAVRTSPVWGGSLDLALQTLSSAAFYKTVTPTAQLGSLTPGDIIYLNENGSPVEFYVASLNYEPDYKDGRVLVVRKDAAQQGAWNSTGVNTYDGSTIDTWFNSTYLQTLDSDVQTAIGTTNIPYTPMGGDTSVQRISKAVFALSGTELNKSNSTMNVEGTALSISSILQIALLNNEKVYQWTRSAHISNINLAWCLDINGNVGAPLCTTSYGYRPAFTLPSTFIANTSSPTTGLYDISNNLLLSLPGVNIETGSYVGTGTYGSGNPNSLTFGFVPKLVVIQANSESDLYAVMIYGALLTKSAHFTTSSSPLYLEWSGVTIKYWNNDNAQNQLNGSGNPFRYLAIG